MTRLGPWARCCLLPAGLVLVSIGCGWWPTQTQSTSGDSNDDAAQDGQVLSGTAERPPPADEVAEIEPNDDFASAQLVGFNETVRISGAVNADAVPYDSDVFDLGPVAAGDRIVTDLEVEGGADVVLGLFDGRERILGYIDMTNWATGPRESDLVIRESTDRLRVVLSTRSGSDVNRPYTARISMQRGMGEAVERPQVLVLNFSGAAGVQIGSRAPVDVPPFDAGNISPAFAGQTQTVIDLILEEVRANFAGLNVNVYVAGDPAIPAGDHSTIYFGTYDARLLGLADNVDPYNAQPVQSAILYTDTFAVFNALSPTIGQIARVLANTTSHEAGHLLGLRHTADPTDLMDTTASARQMMLPQDFHLADLNATVLPIGLQDAPTMLAWALGGSLVEPSGRAIAHQRAIEAAGSSDDFYIPREWLMDCPCTHCASP